MVLPEFRDRLMSPDQHSPESTTLPVKSVDPSENVSTRVSDNVRTQIGPARYFVEDRLGNVDESWEDVFDRVSRNVAIAEVAHAGDQLTAPLPEGGEGEITEQTAHNFLASEEFLESLPEHVRGEYEEQRKEFYDAMSELRFVPNTPTLTSAATELQMLSACIAGHSPVYTDSGLKRMDEISPGDKVLTHKGRFREVLDHWSNGERDTVEMKRGPSSKHHYDCVLTSDHEVLNREGEWVQAGDLRDPANPELPTSGSFPDHIELYQYTARLSDRKSEKEIVTDSGSIKLRNYSDYSDREFDGQISEPSATIENTPDLAWLIGLYLAEGDVYGTETRFTLGSDESDLANRLIEVVDELFDLPVSVSESNHGSWTQYRISSAFVSDFFATICGTGVAEKRLPEWVGDGREEYQRSLFQGLVDGDGHDDGNGYKIALANPTLLYEVSLLARTIGHECAFKLDASRSLSSRDTSECYVSRSDRSRLRGVSKRSGETVEVYDMEVAEDHSFTVGDFIVHNCFVNSPDDNMESIFETTKEWGLTEKAGGGMGAAFYQLRPKGDPVSTTGGVSSGPMEFIRLYNSTGHTIKQGGTRSGAQMAVFHAHHPDVGRFCTAKRGDDDLTCFNISVGITDEFLDAVEADEDYVFEDPKTGVLGFDAEPFEVVPETAHFYDPQFEDAWNDEYDKAGIGYDEKVVEENFWRDHYDNMGDPSRFDKYRDRIEIIPGEEMKLPARFVWELIVDGAHNNGEPGVLYLDEAERQHSFDVEKLGDFEYHQFASNPCAEQYLGEYEACNLGHVNLSLMVDEDREIWGNWRPSRWTGSDAQDIENLVSSYLDHALDEEMLEQTVRTGVRLLDDVITMNDFPLDQIDKRVRELRKIGVGVMGFHQMLLQLGIEYGSDVSVEVGREVMRRVDMIATNESHNLATERGVFPAWEDSKWSTPTDYPTWFQKHSHELPYNWRRGYPIRNHNVTTVAPTGTTGRIGYTSLSIEPIYNVAFFSNVSNDIQGDEMLVDFDDYFRDTLEANGIDAEDVKEEAKKLMLDNGFDGPSSLSSVPDTIGDIFVTTNDVSPEGHVNILTAFQEYVDSSISKTCNLPNEATHEEVSDIFRKALHEGAKSVTVYRDGSRGKQVLTTRVDNSLDGDVTIEDALDVIVAESEHLTVGTEHQLRKELGIKPSPDDSERTCEECGSGTLDLSEGCPVCLECGFSPCK